MKSSDPALVSGVETTIGMLFEFAVGARHRRHARSFGDLLGADFVAELFDGLRRRADEGDLARAADFCEVRVFAQETIAGMNRFHVADFSRGDDVVDLEVAFLRRRRADANGLVGELEVNGVLVGLGIDDDRFDIEALAGADDAQRNFTPVGDQNACEHE